MNIFTSYLPAAEVLPLPSTTFASEFRTVPVSKNENQVPYIRLLFIRSVRVSVSILFASLKNGLDEYSN
jgi:hypothetical protein